MKYRELIKGEVNIILPLLIGSNPRLILCNQPALTKFGRCEQYTIDSVVDLIITKLINGIFVENEVTRAAKLFL